MYYEKACWKGRGASPLLPLLLKEKLLFSGWEAFIEGKKVGKKKKKEGFYFWDREGIFKIFIKILGGEGNGTPLQYSCLENPMDRRAWEAAVHGVTGSWTRLSAFTSLCTFTHWRRKWQPTPVFLPGESQDGGAWWAAVYGVAQSKTRLKRLSSKILGSQMVEENFK